MDLLHKFGSVKILIVGDVMLDHYVHGSVTRISPEAPVPILDVIRSEYYLGGSGNILRNIKSMGGNADIITTVGDDTHGNTIKNLIAEHSDDSFVLLDPTRKTTLKSRYISGSNQLFRVDDENKNYIGTLSEEAIISRFDEMYINYDCVLIEDYNKGLLTPNIISNIISKCNISGIPVIADPKILNISSYSGCKLLKPNLSEFSNMTGFNGSNLDLITLEKHARKFISDNNIDSILVTLSEKGLIYINKDEAVYDPGYPMDVYDVSGAGDTVISILSLCMVSNIGIRESLSICNIAASIACSKSGTVAVDINDILNSKFYTF